MCVCMYACMYVCFINQNAPCRCWAPPRTRNPKLDTRKLMQGYLAYKNPPPRWTLQ